MKEIILSILANFLTELLRYLFKKYFTYMKNLKGKNYNSCQRKYRISWPWVGIDKSQKALTIKGKDWRLIHLTTLSKDGGRKKKHYGRKEGRVVADQEETFVTDIIGKEAI